MLYAEVAVSRGDGKPPSSPFPLLGVEPTVARVYMNTCVTAPLWTHR